MKKLAIILLIIGLKVNLVNAKDISIKVKNQNTFSIDLYVGILTPQQNGSSDEDIISNRNNLGIANLGQSIQANKESLFIKTGVRKDRFIIIFGQFKGGGRTEIKRFNSNDIRDSKIIEITYESFNTITPNNTFINIENGLKQINNTGAYVELESTELLGTFLLYRSKTDSASALIYPIIPKNKVVVERSNTKSTTVEDILSSEANAKISVEFPMSSQVKGVFGTSKVMSLAWVVVNSGPVVYKPENGSYYDLFLSCSEKDKKLALDEFLKDSKNTKLLFIRNAHLTDTVRLESYTLSKIDFGIQLQADDIVDVSGNYKRSKSSSLKSKEIRIIKNVNGLDVSIILQSEIIQKKEQELSKIKAITDSLKSEIPDLIVSGNSLMAIKESLVSPSNIDKINIALSNPNSTKLNIDIETLKKIKEKIDGQ